jgi:hypothetical protein
MDATDHRQAAIDAELLLAVIDKRLDCEAAERDVYPCASYHDDIKSWLAKYSQMAVK